MHHEQKPERPCRTPSPSRAGTEQSQSGRVSEVENCPRNGSPLRWSRSLRQHKGGPMTLDLSTLVFVFFAIMLLQPLLMGRWFAVRRAQAIRAIERSHGSRVITMIHRQEKRSLFGLVVARQIYLGDSQAIFFAVKETTEAMHITLV